MALGFDVNLESGDVRPSSTKLADLITDTKAALHAPCISEKNVRQLVDRWSDIMLLRRPLLSIFQKVYSPSRAVSIQMAVKRELARCIALTPTVYRNVYREFWGI